MTHSRHAGAATARSRVAALDAQLRRASDPVRATNEKAYLKSPLLHYGVPVPLLRRTVGSVIEETGGLSRRPLLALVRLLWRSQVHEHRMAAVLVLERGEEQLEPGDLGVLEEMIRGSFTWAYVDPLAKVAGTLLERNPDLATQLDRWAEDESFWVRRSAMLALLGPIKAGAGGWRRLRRYADAMLDEQEFFVRKAIGWALREASKRRPEWVRRYVASRLDRMSGVTFREAVRHLPEADRRGLERARAAR